MNITFEHPFLKEIFEILVDRPDAQQFLVSYFNYCHRIDDMIDQCITESEYILKTQALASDIMNCKFWQENASFLYIVDALVNNDYADANLWENNVIEWKKSHADVLRHSGNLMLYTVILITKGREALRSISPKLREVSYLMHHDKETGLPV